VIAVAAQGGSKGATVVGATDTAGNTYQVDATRSFAGTGACNSAIVSAHLATPLAAGDTITVTMSSGAPWGFVADQWTGIAGTVDQTGGADSGNTAASTVTVSTNGSTSAANEAVIATTCLGGLSSISAGSGYTLSRDLAISGTAKRELGVEFATTTSAGPQTAMFSLGTARNWSAAVATYA
jgi:hypothetical protein